nr:DUF2642 domain-containing protein [uncultured Bacillus sp.]
MNGLRGLCGKEVEVEISGRTVFSGILIDVGLDIIVLFDGEDYHYIPILHLHNIKEREMKFDDEGIPQPSHIMPFLQEKEEISYRKILTNAKGQFLEVYVTGNKSIHGYITSVLNDYIVFYSPIYKTLFISMQHLKWLTPYSKQLTPYLLSNKELPVMPSVIPLARSFDEQIKKYENHLLVFDFGEHPNKVGVLKNIANNIVELVNAQGNITFWKLTHLKTVHIP